jgi:hypothetical protein
MDAVRSAHCETLIDTQSQVDWCLVRAGYIETY